METVLENKIKSFGGPSAVYRFDRLSPSRSSDPDNNTTNGSVNKRNSDRPTWCNAMLVDDDEVSLFIARSFLKQLDCLKKIEIFQRADRALEHLKEHADNRNELPDLLLLDLDMPVLNGWEFLGEFAHIAPKLIKQPELWVVSSTISPDEVKRAQTHPMVNRFVSKPLQSRHLNINYSSSFRPRLWGE